MFFEINKSQKQIQQAVRDFVKGRFKKETIQEIVENQAFPEEIWRKASELGLIGIHFPEEYSGQGLGCFENALVAEALCCGDASVGGCLAGAAIGSEMILRHGSRSQKSAWLPKIAEGEILSSAAFSESGDGRGFANIKSIAVKQGDSWVIEGTKSYVLNGGPLAGFYIVLCGTGSEPAPGQELSMILVEADREGIAVEDVGHKLGGRLMHIGKVRFEKVRVPLDNLVGKENQGLQQVADHLSMTRTIAAAQSVGIAQGACERAMAHVKQRVQFATRLIDFQVTRHKLADMLTKIESARLLTYQAAWKFDAGNGDERLSAMAKMHASRIAVEVCDEAIQLLGGYGYIQEYEVERFFREAKMIEVLWGNREAQMDTISNTMQKRSAA
ncbi:MAG: acyl-CoA dehydrogenase family protein [Deltaproteobacteria bacterium]|nr:acyl-CoA dehydrogenase family protein [Deltaproteobacteria bacterium]